MRSLRLALAVAAWVALGWPATAAAQQPSQGESLAEAARQARQQKARAPKAARVYTNDNLPSGPGGISAPPSTRAAEPTGAAETGGEQAAASKEEEKERKDLEAEIAKTKERLAVLKKDLELLSRDYDLQRQQFSSNPDYANDTAGRARYDSLGSQVAAKRQEVQETEQKLAALEEKLKEINLKAGPEKETSNPSEDPTFWRAKLQPLREELARVEAQIQQMRAATSGATPSRSGGEWGGFTGNTIAQLEERRSKLERQIAEIEDEARRAGVPPAWVR